MPRICILTIVLYSSILSAQESFISVVSALSERHEIVDDVKEVSEKVFSLYNQNDSATPDTVLFINEAEQALYLTSTVKREYISPYERLDTHYKADGSFSHSFLTKFNKYGNAIYQKQDFGESKTAAMMNSETEYQFDTQGRITTVLNNGQEYFSLKYEKDYIIKELSMNAGFMTINASSEKIKDTLRYDFKVDLDEEMAAIMGDNEMPVEYMDLVIEDDLYCYYHFKQNDENQDVALQSVHIYNKDLELVHEKTSAYNGEMSHLEYKYDEAGKITELVNHNDNTVLEWQYDVNGNVLVEYENGLQQTHEYDDKGKIVQSISRMGKEGAIDNITFKKYTLTKSSSSTLNDEK